MATETSPRRVYNLDPLIFAPDPRKLDTLKQTFYVIRCLEHGLNKEDIINLFMGDDFSVNIIFELIRDNNLVSYDTKSGAWKRSVSTQYLYSKNFD